MILLLILFLVSTLIFIIVVLIKRFKSPESRPLIKPVKSEQTSPNVTTMTIGVDEKTLANLFEKAHQENQQKIKDYRYVEEFVQVKIFQALESIEILETTKNLDTLQSRYDFLGILFRELNLASYTLRYPNDLQTALDNYKQMYYDKIPTQVQLVGLLKPNEFDMDTFYSNAIYNCFMRHYEFQMKQISVLKTENGKKGRFKKLQESARTASDLILKDCISSTDFHKLHNHLKKIEKELFSKSL